MGMSHQSHCFCHGRWWAEAEEDDWPDEEEEKADIRRDFEGEWGDRRQELVFIGKGFDEARKQDLRRKLDACLLTEEEMARGPTLWRRLKDPFPVWE
jgi:G3E family GTPase